MATQTRTVTAALNFAIALQTPLATDPQLTGAERAQVSENLQRCNQALADVNPNTNIVPPNRRQAHFSGLSDRVFATTIISDKYWATAPEVMYDALDLMLDAAVAIRDGVPSFQSDLSAGNP